MKLSESLKRARMRAGLTQGALATASGVRQQVIAKIERDGQRSTSYVPQLAKACGLTVEEFLSGRYDAAVAESAAVYAAVEQAPPHTVRIPYYQNVSASAGHGCVALDEANVTMLDLARSLLDRCGVSASDAALLQASGDSMRGVIEHGDLMIVDLSQHDVREGKIFVVSIDGELLVKRVQRIPRGIKLVSENPSYDSITIMDKEQDSNVRLIGRVALSWSMTGFM